MKKFVVLVLLACIASFRLYAKQISVTEAINRSQIAQARYRGIGYVSSNEYKLIYTAEEKGNNLYYVVCDKTGSEFSIMSADDLAPAVLAYGLAGFDMDNLPANVEYWLNEYKKDISEAIETQNQVRSRESKALLKPVLPLMKTTWGQRAPFNDKLSGNLAGCVSVAVAQVMNYHKCPKRYDWAAMQDHYGDWYTDGTGTSRTYVSYTDKAANAVAKLINEVGQASKTEYGSDLSGATLESASLALTLAFGYDKGLIYRSRMYYDDEEWESMLMKEIDNARPVVYGGATVADEGHSFVLDGYDASGFFHINWGWYGLCDGYFLLTGSRALLPAATGAGGAASGKGYTEHQMAIFGVTPEKFNTPYVISIGAPKLYNLSQGKFCYYATTMTDGSNIVTQGSKGATYYIYGPFINNSLTTAYVDMALKFRNTADPSIEYTCDLGIRGYELAPQTGFSYISFTTSAIQKNGEYEMIPIFRKCNSLKEPTGSWEEVQTIKSTTPHAFVIKDADNSPVYVSRIKLTKTETKLKIGTQLTLQARTLPETADYHAIAWSSSNNKVATVKDGVVTAVGKGTATITVTAQDRKKVTATCVVTVSDEENVGCYNPNISIKTTDYGTNSTNTYMTFEIRNSGPYDIEITELLIKEKNSFMVRGYYSGANGVVLSNSTVKHTVALEAREYEFEAHYIYKENDFIYFSNDKDPSYVTYDRYENYTSANGCESLTTEDAVPVKYMDITGKAINGPQKGIMIIRYSDGTVRKVRQ